jgi:hypothetical protein
MSVGMHRLQEVADETHGGARSLPRFSHWSPVISDTQAWIEIAYLDSCSDYRESLLDARLPTTTKRRTMGARNWLLVLALIAFAILIALWILR